MDRLRLFATAYLIRPFSSLLFGYCSDRFGRKPPMILAMALMGVATLMIGLLPSYTEIGLLSPILGFYENPPGKPTPIAGRSSHKNRT